MKQIIVLIKFLASKNLLTFFDTVYPVSMVLPDTIVGVVRTWHEILGEASATDAISAVLDL